MHTRIAPMLAGLGLAVPAMGNIIVNGDFQMGSLGPSTSSYSFQNTVGSASLPVDSIYDEGTYSIVTHDTIHGNWVDYYDHTHGDANGRYMIINGADNGDGPAWTQTVAISPGSSYTLSAWFSSLHPAAIANLEWRLVGDDSLILSPGFLAPASVGTWDLRTFEFNSGANSSLTIELWDTSGIASGNDYAVDDIALNMNIPAPGVLALFTLGLAPMRRSRR